jgi:hypothetical protein
MTKTLLHATSHMTTVAFLTVEFALLLAGVGPSWRGGSGGCGGRRRGDNGLCGDRGRLRRGGSVLSSFTASPRSGGAHRHRGARLVGSFLAPWIARSVK